MLYPDIVYTPAYKKAFNLYLRRGIPIELSLKAALQEHPTTHYIWRTRGDGKVRASHAANNGRIFSWDNPPPVGHPGEDFGCRCTAEPYYGHVIYDPPIETVYPELVLIPLLRVSRGAIALAIGLISRISRYGKINKPDNLTDHGAIRTIQRKVSSEGLEEADLPPVF